jgi:hypothetical protein
LCLFLITKLEWDQSLQELLMNIWRDDEPSRKAFDEEEGYLELFQHLVLHRPYCLLELNHAIVKKIPIEPVLIEGEGYMITRKLQNISDI